MAVVVLPAWLMWCKVTKPETDDTKTVSDEEFAISLMPCAVMVNAGEAQGSGVILDISNEMVTIVTAGHLMNGYNQGIITFNTGQAGFADVKYCSDKPDICIMTFSTDYIDSSLLKELDYAKNSESNYEKLNSEDKVMILGSATGVGSNATKGTVADKEFYVDDFDATMLYLYADVYEGMSGCGVYDEEGFLLGIIVGGTDNGEAVAVPLSQIYEKWEEIENDKN